MAKKINQTDLQRTLITTYRKDIWAPFIRAIQEYKLIEENDKIAVAISGGKDSLLLAKLFQYLQSISDFPFELEFISMDPGFNKETLQQLKDNCQLLDIPVQIEKSDVFFVADKISKSTPCYMCARMRRGFLYNSAKQKGCNKLALGHHFDDVVETTLLNVFYGSQYKTMVPKIKAENFEGMTLIRPLVLIKEKDIIRFANYTKISTIGCGCTLTNKDLGTKRSEIKDLIKQLEKNNSNVKQSIFKSATNVNISQVYGYSDNGTKLNFNEIYDKTLIKKDENQ